MNIILLSGGSGKRLWPLSNDIRSKQFLKLFRAPDGSLESMLQRVFRQIKTADPEARITIATSKTQVSAIMSQLSDEHNSTPRKRPSKGTREEINVPPRHTKSEKPIANHEILSTASDANTPTGDVSISVEPQRRDTFPAILLAVRYITDVLGRDPAEPVVVCPVDPYVENSYYETLCTLPDYVMADTAHITLMGVEPSYPSPNFGYILPASKDRVSPVVSFKEKPSEDLAATYISEGALWNAGVFAFRMSYLLKKAEILLPHSNYNDLFARYASAEKISFDYAVLEKEPSIQTIRYKGSWKDVGTWNMICDVMADNVMGDAVLDQTCENTNIINELDLPILALGTKDMIIAASPDGILVSDKNRSAHLKPYVEKLNNSVRYAEKSWGTYRVIDSHIDGYSCEALTVRLDLRCGKALQYQSHALRNVIWTVICGYGRTIVDGKEQTVKPGDTVSVAAGCRHTLIADTDLSVIEIQVGEQISKQDKKKYKMPLPAQS